MPYDLIWLQKNTVNSQGDTKHESIKNLIRTIGAKFVTARRRQKMFSSTPSRYNFSLFLSISLCCFSFAGSCQAIFSFVHFHEKSMYVRDDVVQRILFLFCFFYSLLQTFQHKHFQHTGQRSFICMIWLCFFFTLIFFFYSNNFSWLSTAVIEI